MYKYIRKCIKLGNPCKLHKNNHYLKWPCSDEGYSPEKRREMFFKRKHPCLICKKLISPDAHYCNKCHYKVYPHHFKGKWVVENVKPYYIPLIEPTKVLQRHLFWSNFDIADMNFKKDKIRTAQIPQLSALHGFDLSSYKLSNKRQILRNCVLPELGKHVINLI